MGMDMGMDLRYMIWTEMVSIIQTKYIRIYSKYRYRYGYGYSSAIYPISIVVILHLEKYKYGMWGGVI